MTTAEAAAWREQWIATMQRRARVEIPALLRTTHAQRLQTIESSPATSADTGEIDLELIPTAPLVSPSITPLPETRLPETGGMPRLPDNRRETAMLSAISLLRSSVTIRPTRALISDAVQHFFARHGLLPSSCQLNPLRVLTIERPDFYALDDQSAEIGCYTIQVAAEESFPIDAVRLLAHRSDGVTIREDYAF